jgi:hypothetical protein
MGSAGHEVLRRAARRASWRTRRSRAKRLQGQRAT